MSGYTFLMPGALQKPIASRRPQIVAWLSTWFRQAFHAPDPMDRRLDSAPSANTPLTKKERAALEESRAQFKSGDFIVDPATAHKSFAKLR